MPNATTTKQQDRRQLLAISKQRGPGSWRLKAKDHPSRPRKRWLLLVRIATLLVLLLIVVVLAADWGVSVVVRDTDGRVVSRSSLPDSGEFGIEYVHSYYGDPAYEHFSADPKGGFELVGIYSPNEAVLDYYELEGRKEADGEQMRLVPHEARRFEELALVGTATGRKTLVLPDRRVPLYTDDGPAHLTLRIEENAPFTEVLGGW